MQRKPKVLAVDDNPVNLAILEEMLSDEYRVSFAQNGPAAIRAAAATQPSFILLDVMLPGMDGLAICRHLRESAGLAETVIIMVSAKAMPSEQAAGLSAGADFYISKPFDEVELMEILRSYAHPKGLEAERYESSAPTDVAQVTF